MECWNNVRKNTESWNDERQFVAKKPMIPIFHFSIIPEFSFGGIE
jgi:hypothetical protein